jgi:hypothetical protein
MSVMHQLFIMHPHAHPTEILTVSHSCTCTTASRTRTAYTTLFDPEMNQVRKRRKMRFTPLKKTFSFVSRACRSSSTTSVPCQIRVAEWWFAAAVPQSLRSFLHTAYSSCQQSITYGSVLMYVIRLFRVFLNDLMESPDGLWLYLWPAKMQILHQRTCIVTCTGCPKISHKCNKNDMDQMGTWS